MHIRPTIALLPATLALALLVPSAHAQRGARGGGGGFPGRFGGRGERRAGNYGYGWGYLPPYYPDESGYWPPAQPQYIPYPVPVQQPQPALEAKPIEPLMIEEQGGQWVRVQDGTNLPLASQTDTSASSQADNQPAPTLPSAVIVFRDGHQEEVARYMIQGNVVYTNADYWSTGIWTRKIFLSDLDVPATLKLNQERGTKFTLPSSPNEIMVRF